MNGLESMEGILWEIISAKVKVNSDTECAVICQYLHYGHPQCRLFKTFVGNGVRVKECKKSFGDKNNKPIRSI